LCTDCKKDYDAVRSVILLSVFAKSHTSQLSSVYVTVCPSSSKTRLPLDEYSSNLICSVSLKSDEKNEMSLESDKKNEYLKT